MDDKKRRRFLFRVLCALFFFLALAGVTNGPAAETITLKNGQVLSGKVVGQSRSEIRLQTPQGLRVIKKADVRRISYDSPADIERRRRAEAEQSRRAELKAKQEAEAREKEAEDARKKQEQQDAAGERPLTVDADSDGLSYTGFAVRNAVLPGWGFFANDQPVIGTTYAALTAGAVYYAFATRQAALAAKDENFAQVELNTLLTLVPNGVDQATRLGFGLLANQAAYGPYQSKIDSHNQSLQILGLIYFAQLAHTAALAPGWPAPGRVSIDLPESGARIHFGFVGISAPRANGRGDADGGALIGAGLSLSF